MRQQVNYRLPDITIESIDLIVETYGLTKTQTVILAVDRLARDLYPFDDSERAIRAQTEAHLLADNGNETGDIEQA